MTISEAFRHIFNPQDNGHAVVAKKVADAEKNLKDAAADNAAITKLLEQTLKQNAHH